MKGSDKYIFYVLIIIGSIIGCFIFSSDFEGYTDLITFLSIMIGFKITSLSILFNSPLKRVLFDKKHKLYKTELNRLRDYYSFSINFDIISLMIIFILPNKGFCFSIDENCYHFGKHLITMPILVGTIYCFYKVYNDLLKIFTHPTNH